MVWDIDFVYVVPGKTEENMKLLKAKGAEGWEPYAVVGVTHYFKKQIEPPVQADKDKISNGKHKSK